LKVYPFAPHTPASLVAMGCGASAASTPINDAQMMSMCQCGAKEMLRLSSRVALNKTDDITVPAPDIVANLRGNVASLREKAAAAKAALVLEANPEEDKSGGMLGGLGAMAGGKLGGFAGGLVSKAGDLADKAVDKAGDLAEAGAAKAGDVAGDVLEASLNKLAEMLEKAVDAFEAPFTTVGKDITGAKKIELLKVYEDYIETIDVVNPTNVVRGVKNAQGQWGPEEYEAVQGSGLSAYFNNISKEALEGKLLTVVEEEVAKHSITNLSQLLIEDYNKVAASDVLKQVGLTLDPIEMNIGVHIVQHTILKLGTFIAENEADYRKNSEGKSDRMPATFAKIYSGAPLFLSDFEEFDAKFGKQGP